MFRRSRAANSIVSGPIWPKFELVWEFMHVLVTCKYKKDRIKNNREKVETSFFFHYKSMGAFCCHGNQSFDPIGTKTLYSLSPTPVMLHIKLDQDWPTGFRDIQVWRCGRRRRTDHWYTISSPCEPSARVWANKSEPLHEKTCLIPYANNKGADQPAHQRSLVSAFVGRCLDSIIPILAKSKSSRL